MNKQQYAKAMKEAAELLQHGHLSESRSVLLRILEAWPSDGRARSILKKIDAAASRNPTRDIPLSPRYHSEPDLRRKLKAVKKAISQVSELPWKSIADDVPLSEYGLDELNLVEITICLEEELNVELDDLDTADASLTARSLAERL